MPNGKTERRPRFRFRVKLTGYKKGTERLHFVFFDSNGNVMRCSCSLSEMRGRTYLEFESEWEASLLFRRPEGK